MIIKRVFACYVALIGLWASGSFGTTLAAQPERGLKIATITEAQGQEAVLYQESHALVIGVSNYTNGWPNLPGVQQDVQEVQRALEAQGFHVVVKMDLEQTAGSGGPTENQSGLVLWLSFNRSL